MSVDTLSNLFSSIKNASMRRKKTVEVPYSKLSEAVLKVIRDKGFISDVRVFKEKDTQFKAIAVDLKYEALNMPAISNIERVSKPGLRIYKKASDLENVRSGLGFYVVSTPKGVLPSNEARKRKLGGEVICKIY